MLARPAPSREPDRALVGAERLRRRDRVVAARLGEQLERRAQQRRVVLAGDEIAVPVGGAAGAHERDVGFREAVAGDELANDEREAGRHRVDRNRLALQLLDRRDRRRRDDRDEAAVAAHECEEVGIVGDLRLALPFLVRDDVVDRGERDVGLAVEHRRDEEAGRRRVGELDVQPLRLEQIRCAAPSISAGSSRRRTPAPAASSAAQRAPAHARMRRRTRTPRAQAVDRPSGSFRWRGFREPRMPGLR